MIFRCQMVLLRKSIKNSAAENMHTLTSLRVCHFFSNQLFIQDIDMHDHYYLYLILHGKKSINRPIDQYRWQWYQHYLVYQWIIQLQLALLCQTNCIKAFCCWIHLLDWSTTTNYVSHFIVIGNTAGGWMIKIYTMNSCTSTKTSGTIGTMLPWTWDLHPKPTSNLSHSLLSTLNWQLNQLWFDIDIRRLAFCACTY